MGPYIGSCSPNSLRFDLAHGTFYCLRESPDRHPILRSHPPYPEAPAAFWVWFRGVRLRVWWPAKFIPNLCYRGPIENTVCKGSHYDLSYPGDVVTQAYVIRQLVDI